MRPAGLRRRRRLEMRQRNRFRPHQRLAWLGRVLARRRRFGHGPVALARRLVGTVAVAGRHCTRGLRPGWRLESHPGLRTCRAGLTCAATAAAPTAASATTPATTLAALGALTVRRLAGDPRGALARRAGQGFRARQRLITWLDLAARGGAALGATLRAASRTAIAPALVATTVPASVPTAIAVVAIAIPAVATTVAAITPGAICETRTARRLAPALTLSTVTAVLGARWGCGRGRLRGRGCRWCLAGHEALEAAPEPARLRSRRRRGSNHRGGGAGGRGRGRRQERRYGGGLHVRLLVLRRAGFDHLGRGRHEVGGLAVLGQIQLVIAHAFDRVLRRLHVLVRNDNELRLGLVLEGAQPFALFVNEVGRHCNRHLRDHARGAILAQLLADQAQHRERHG